MRLESLGIWAANLLAVTVLPASLGRSGPRMLDFAIYSVVAGLLLTCLEDKRYLLGLVERSEVRAYVKVRIAVVGLAALGPYLAGAAAW